MTEKESKYAEVFWTFYDEIEALPRIDRATVYDLNTKNIRAIRTYAEASRSIELLELKIVGERRRQREAVAARDGYIDIATRLGYDPEWLKHGVHTNNEYRAYIAEVAEEE